MIDPPSPYGSSLDISGEEFDNAGDRGGFTRGLAPCSYLGDKQGGSPLVRTSELFRPELPACLVPARPA